MDKIAALREERNRKLEAMENVLSVENFDDSTQATFDALQSEVDSIGGRISRIEKLEAQRIELAKPEPSIAETAAVSPGAKAPGAIREFECFAEIVSSVNEAQHGRRVDSRLSWQEFRADQRMDDGPSGGFHVPAQFIPTVLSVPPAEHVITKNCVKIGSPNSSHPDAPVSMPALDQTGNQFGGVTVGRIGEGAPKPETDVTSRLITWTPTELAAHIPYTDKILRNWPGMRGLIDAQLGGALASAMEQEAFTGAGGLEFSGIRDHASAITIARDTADTFLLADLVQMVSASLDRPGFKCWLINTRLRGAVMTLQNAAGFMLWQPGLVAGQPGTLDGKPVYWYEYAGAQGALGAVALVNLDYYVMHQASGYYLEVGMSNDDFTRNQRRVKIFTMNDAQPWLTAPFTLANGEAASPFVLLGANP